MLERAKALNGLTAAARPIAEVVLVLLLAKIAAGFVWIGWPPTNTASLEPTRSTTATSAPQVAAMVDRSALTTYDPFRTVIVAEPSFEDAPDTTLNLTLAGIRRASGENESVAYVMLPDGEFELVRAGDPLTRGVEVRRVLADRVVLARDGRDEVLRFRPDQAPFSGEGAVQSAARPVSTPSSERSATPAPQGDGGITAEGIAQGFEWRPVRDDGEMIGLAVYPKGDGRLFASTGLRPADVVVSINGIDPSNTSAFVGMLEELNHIDALELIVDRNGAREAFSIALDK